MRCHTTNFSIFHSSWIGLFKQQVSFLLFSLEISMHLPKKICETCWDFRSPPWSLPQDQLAGRRANSVGSQHHWGRYWRLTGQAESRRAWHPRCSVLLPVAVLTQKADDSYSPPQPRPYFHPVTLHCPHRPSSLSLSTAPTDPPADPPPLGKNTHTLSFWVDSLRAFPVGPHISPQRSTK